MIRALLALALLFPASAWASYSCNSTDDDLAGTLTTTLAQPFTLFAYVKYADHPVAANNFIQLGLNANNNDSARITAGAAEDRYVARTDNNVSAVGSATFNASANQFNNAWLPVIATFSSNTLRQ